MNHSPDVAPNRVFACVEAAAACGVLLFASVLFFAS
jgi:hypothetical protein